MVKLIYMNAKFVDGIFSFDGFKNNQAWYEWFITAESFILDVQKTQK